VEWPVGHSASNLCRNLGLKDNDAALDPAFLGKAVGHAHISIDTEPLGKTPASSFESDYRENRRYRDLSRKAVIV
jgi:hypothetical protein